jgi:hypothetical protein
LSKEQYETLKQKSNLLQQKTDEQQLKLRQGGMEGLKGMFHYQKALVVCKSESGRSQ